MNAFGPVRLVELPAVRVACLRHVGAYGPALQRFWAGEVTAWLARHGWLEREAYGISHDDPVSTPAALCRYDACVVLAPGEQPGPGVDVAEVAGGRYAVLDFAGPVAQVGEAWRHLLVVALADTALQLDRRPCFERYAAGEVFDAATGTLRCGLFVPVVAAPA